MTPVSKDEAQRVERLAGLERRFAEIDGYTVTFETYTEDHDYAALDKGLPGNRCPCPTGEWCSRASSSTATRTGKT